MRNDQSSLRKQKKYHHVLLVPDDAAHHALFCMGKVLEWDQPEFEPLVRKMGKEKTLGARATHSTRYLQSRYPFFQWGCRYYGTDESQKTRRSRPHVALKYRSSVRAPLTVIKLRSTSSQSSRTARPRDTGLRSSSRRTSCMPTRLIGMRRIWID